LPGQTQKNAVAPALKSNG